MHPHSKFCCLLWCFKKLALAALFGLSPEKSNKGCFNYVKYISEKRLKLAHLNDEEMHLMMVLQSHDTVCLLLAVLLALLNCFPVFTAHMSTLSLPFSSCNLDHKLLKARILILPAKSPVSRLFCKKVLLITTTRRSAVLKLSSFPAVPGHSL